MIEKAKTDNTDLFRSFAASIGATPLPTLLFHFRPYAQGDNVREATLGSPLSLSSATSSDSSKMQANEMIVAGCPNAFIRDPEPTKTEWDKVKHFIQSA